MSKQAGEMRLPTNDGRELVIRWNMRAITELEELIQTFDFKNLKDFATQANQLSIGIPDMVKCLHAGLAHMGDRRPSPDDLIDILDVEGGFAGFTREFMVALALAMSGPEGAASVKKSLLEMDQARLAEETPTLTLDPG